MQADKETVPILCIIAQNTVSGAAGGIICAVLSIEDGLRERLRRAAPVSSGSVVVYKPVRHTVQQALRQYCWSVCTSLTCRSAGSPTVIRERPARIKWCCIQYSRLSDRTAGASDLLLSRLSGAVGVSGCYADTPRPPQRPHRIHINLKRFTYD